MKGDLDTNRWLIYTLAPTEIGVISSQLSRITAPHSRDRDVVYPIPPLSMARFIYVDLEPLLTEHEREGGS